MADSQFRADPQQLKQVVINLVQNASESIGRDGTITLRSREGNARLKGKPTEAVMLEVQDDGPGVPPEVQGAGLACGLLDEIAPVRSLHRTPEAIPP